MKISQFSQLLLRKYPENVRVVIYTAIYGTLAGGVAVLFLLATNLIFSKTYLAMMTLSKKEFVFGSLATITVTSVLVGVLMAIFGREAAGSGIPQLKAAFWKDLGYVKLRPVCIKFIAGALSIGGGASLGREGPTVYIAGGLASWVAGLLGIPKQGRRHAVAVGAAAGLAAAFNTPLAAITFVLEELVGDMNSRLLGSVVLSSLAGAFVVFAVIGKHPAFGIQMDDTWSWNMYSFSDN